MKRNNDPRYYVQNKSQSTMIRNKVIQQNMIKKYIEEQNKYVFIHPTKVAGSAFIKYVEKYYSQHFEYKGHNTKVSQVNNPIIFIRDPYDRFISMYKYWKYGSYDYNEHQHNINHLQNVEKYNIKDFINFVKNKNPILITPFTSFIHIMPQNWWIEEADYHKCIIVIYDKNKMEEKVFQLLDYLESKKILENKKYEFPKINVSNHTNKENIILDSEDINQINILYENDFKLIEKIKNNSHFFKKIF
jgi:hypothetical protein